MTVEQGHSQQRYQGYVPLQDESLEAAAHTYFRQSGADPDRHQACGGRDVRARRTGRRPPELAGRAALSASSCRCRRIACAAATCRPATFRKGRQVASEADNDDDAWVEAQALIDTVEDHELTDPAIAAERLLYRLFHERGVRVFEPICWRRTAPARASASSRCWCR
jgi:molecular chaperone Hsp33